MKQSSDDVFVGDGGDDNNVDSLELSLDAVLDLLSHQYVRSILYHLIDQSGQVATVDELVDQIADSEAKERGVQPSRNHIELALYHIHLPRLEDVGVVGYDPRSKEVRYYGSQRLETWLKRIADEEQD